MPWDEVPGGAQRQRLAHVGSTWQRLARFHSLGPSVVEDLRRAAPTARRRDPRWARVDAAEWLHGSSGRFAHSGPAPQDARPADLAHARRTG